MITFWCEDHPIIRSKLNVTFHHLIRMNHREFAMWSESVRQFLGRRWVKDGIPPHDGTSLEQIENDMRGLSMHRTYDFLQRDESTFRRDVIVPDSRYGSFLKCLFTNMNKAADGNKLGFSLFDYLTASRKTVAGRALIADWNRRIETSVRYDGLYQFSQVLRRTDKQGFGVKDGSDWIREFGRELKFWLETVNEKPRRSDLIVLPLDVKKLIKGRRLKLNQVKSTKRTAPTHYRVRIYDPEVRIFPKLFNVLRVGVVRQGTNFPALVAKYLYQKYTNHLRANKREIVIYDPSAGYGGRCFAALAAACDRPIRYVGTDPNSENWIAPSQSRYAALAQFYNAVVGQKYQAKIDIFHLGSEVIHRERKFKKYRGKIDLVFTSPPYFCAEIYSQEETQSAIKFPDYKSWRNGFLRRTLETCVDYLRPGGFLLWNIADISHKGVFVPLEADSRSALTELGMTFRGKLKLLLSASSGGRKMKERVPMTKNYVVVNGSIRKYEPIFVFQKPL